MTHATGFASSITQRFAAWVSPRQAAGVLPRASERAEVGIAANGPAAMPASALAPTVSNDDIDDACVGCEAKTGLDCRRCAYFLDAINRLPVMPAIVVAAPEPVIPAKPIFQPALPAREAAITFVAYLRKHGKCGVYSNGGLKNAYLLYCQREQRRPTAENGLREAMALLPGVSKELIRDRSQRGRRARITEWVISPETVSPTVSRRPRLVEERERLVA